MNSATPLPGSAPQRDPSTARQSGASASVQGIVRPHEDSVSESRSPFAIFVDEGQPPPAQYGRDTYTTRPPWMAQQQALLNGRSLTATYAVDGSSLSPFPVTPASREEVDHSNATQPAAAPLIESAAPVADLSMPRPRRKSLGTSVFTLLFILFAKGVPLMFVLGAGFYTYSYFFGTPPMVQKMMRLINGTPEPGEEDTKPKSRAGQMLQQTRGVVAANDARINFANALAEGAVNLDTLGEPDATNPNDLLVQVSAAVANAHATQPPAEREALSDAPRRARNSRPTYDLSQVIPGRLDLPSPVSPSVAFIIWVDRARISGLRTGETSKIIVNELTVQPEQILDHSLGIVVESVDPATSIVRFRDRNGAIIGKRF